MYVQYGKSSLTQYLKISHTAESIKSSQLVPWSFQCKSHSFRILANLSKSLKKLEILLHNTNFQRLFNIHCLTFMLKDVKPLYTPMREKHDAVVNLWQSKSVKWCRWFCGMVTFLSSFFKDLKKAYQFMKNRSTKTKFNGWKNVKKYLTISNSYGIPNQYYTSWQQMITSDYRVIQAKQQLEVPCLIPPWSMGISLKNIATSISKLLIHRAKTERSSLQHSRFQPAT